MIKYRKDVTTQDIMDTCLKFAQTADVDLATKPVKYKAMPIDENNTCWSPAPLHLQAFRTYWLTPH